MKSTLSACVHSSRNLAAAQGSFTGIEMPSPQSFVPSPVDFVSGDLHALASHMQHCALARGRWSGARNHIQQVSSIAAGHIVTVACVCAALAIGLYAVA